ncbi:hypothetical protein QUA62_26970 [Microcoleus sp. MON1_C1]|uniref:hypothetical protein n=1 Tax=Microcoleus sp. MON1_C1 TaxID=2818827 RepID=UPI002FD09F5A
MVFILLPHTRSIAALGVLAKGFTGRAQVKQFINFVLGVFWDSISCHEISISCAENLPLALAIDQTEKTPIKKDRIERTHVLCFVIGYWLLVTTD